MNELVLVLDFGGQYKQLIASTVRELSVYSEIRPGNISPSEIKKLAPIGIILTGGPSSIYENDSPKCDPKLFKLGIPILGICYGMHLMCQTLGGEVSSAETGEYGQVAVMPEASAMYGEAESALFKGHTLSTAYSFRALMSHRDMVKRLPEGFVKTASTKTCIAACENKNKKLYAVQFHPETKSTDGGYDILKRFLYDVCGASGNYKLDDYIDTQIKEIRKKAGRERVLLALSGGVDSAVCASLLTKAIPNQLTCVFVDHGFMRLNEGDEIERVFADKELTFIRVNAQDRFLGKLAGVTDPEKKRKIIGEEFIRVFEEEAKKLGDIPFLAQGTIYPDIVESGIGDGAVIKSHHNVGGLPENLSFTSLIEPLAGLFKNEVRIIGKTLGLPESLVQRQPFPGPGLAIRVMGELTKPKLDTLRLADAIVREELGKLDFVPNQYFAVLTGQYTVGVKGDDRTYDPVVAVRAVITSDFMTCEYADIPHEVLRRISTRITAEVPGISRVVYDITSKPPSTVEWE